MCTYWFYPHLESSLHGYGLFKISYSPLTESCHIHVCLTAYHIHGTMYRVASICFCIFQPCTSHRTMYMHCHKTYTWKWHDSIKGEYDTWFIFMLWKWQSCTLWPIKDVGIGKMLWDLTFFPLKNKCWLLLSKETHNLLIPTTSSYIYGRHACVDCLPSVILSNGFDN